MNYTLWEYEMMATVDMSGWTQEDKAELYFANIENEMFGGLGVQS